MYLVIILTNLILNSLKALKLNKAIWSLLNVKIIKKRSVILFLTLHILNFFQETVYNGMVNSVDPDETAPEQSDWTPHYLPNYFCYNKNLVVVIDFFFHIIKTRGP